MLDFRHTSGPLEDNYFYGRSDEIEILHNNINIRQHTALIGQRQFGKTALVHKAIERHPNKPLKAHVDLTRKATLHEAAEIMIDAFMLENFKMQRFIVNLRVQPVKTMKDMFSGLGVVKKIKISEFELELQEINLLVSEKEANRSIDLFVKAVELIDLIAVRLDKQVVIFIDEFQRIAQFPEVKSKDLLWPLRSAIQASKATTLIVAGNKPTVLRELISTPESAFFHSFIINDIYGVKEDEFLEHFIGVCSSYGVSYNREATRFVFGLCSGMPSYLSLFGRRVFDKAKKKKELTTEMYFMALEEIFAELSGALRMFEEKISEIPYGAVVYKSVFANENPKAEAVRLSGTSDANIQNNTINKMIESGFIIREGRGDYRAIDTVFGYYMAEITTAEQFKSIYEDKVLSSMLGIKP
jgi:hypothetical protein